MNLEQFATEAGVKITSCDKEWGGTVAYTEKDHPKTTVCGFRTKDQAYVHWLISTFGPSTARAVRKLLARSTKTGKQS